jgi:hypothetical protein
MKLRLSIVILLLTLAALSLGQSWSNAYEAGLKAARATRWAEARAAFLRAAAYRPEDASGPTILPGPATEQRRWRAGAPYSPNFLAAYAGYREVSNLKPEEQPILLNKIANELETLVAKGQRNPLTAYVLASVYDRLGDTQKRTALQERLTAETRGRDWRVDTEVVAPEELAIISSNVNPGQAVQNPVRSSTNPNVSPTVNATVPGASATGTPPTGVPVNPTLAGVPQLESKFALVIGNSESRMPEGNIPFASDDAQKVREALQSYAGYPAANVELAVNATAQQIRATAQALAARVPEEGVVLIYFTGHGVNIGGKDYLAGVDTEAGTDTASMLSKDELYRMFMARGARVFAFYQTNRPIVGGRFFGNEVPIVGSISQVQATLPGDTVSSIIQNGRPVGVFTSAFVSVLNDFRSNRLPIFEFGWQVFYKVRRGDTGTQGGSSRQTPTLPVLSNMASDARF